MNTKLVVKAEHKITGEISQGNVPMLPGKAIATAKLYNEKYLEFIHYTVPANPQQ